jgi:hypothetical protein
MWMPSCLRNITEARQKQLQEERHLDVVLHHCKRDCPELLNTYLLMMRSLNRHLYFQSHEAPFYKYPALCQENMQVLDSYQRPLLYQDSKNICSLLPAIINDIHYQTTGCRGKSE